MLHLKPWADMILLGNTCIIWMADKEFSGRTQTPLHHSTAVNHDHLSRQNRPSDGSANNLPRSQMAGSSGGRLGDKVRRDVRAGS
ncbi:hypothetical protein B0I35DRAFT_438789 [Stachybotrys elegans]|uniref:Uncharacterized protein n=1 Tax=Stachybotrys elegans TaxID=80388 RepID=A0A8K0SLX2_9HYPO|nr:hypothetical protein B0I35DRAFT_438789 [Stachybotrys elegans]